MKSQRAATPFGYDRHDVAVRLVLAAVLAALWLAPAAAAGPLLDRAVTGLESDPVYVDPQAERALSAGDAERLRAEIEANGGGPVYIAVLPEATLAGRAARRTACCSGCSSSSAAAAPTRSSSATTSAPARPTSPRARRGGSRRRRSRRSAATA
jgi:hypothetical protein